MSEFAEKAESGENVAACNNCKHYIKGEKCSAFDFIPDLILLGEDNHSKPLPGQKNEITFTPIDE